MSAISKMDLLLAKAKPISNGCVVRYLRRKKKGIMLVELQTEKSGVRMCERHKFAYAKLSVAGGGGGAGAKISLQPVVKIMVR